MAERTLTLVTILNESPLRELSDSLLRSIPGLPPVLQTVHLTGLAMLLGSIVLLSLRMLGAAAKNQAPEEMCARLFPWFYCALPIMLLSGLPFFLARPQRYLVNPVFGIKAALLFVSLVLSMIMWQQCRQLSHSGITWQLRLISVLVIFSWIMTALAGRWIAYADYLFWPG